VSTQAAAWGTTGQILQQEEQTTPGSLLIGGSLTSTSTNAFLRAEVGGEEVK
jgi:hypothetical protein